MPLLAERVPITLEALATVAVFVAVLAANVDDAAVRIFLIVLFFTAVPLVPADLVDHHRLGP